MASSSAQMSSFEQVAANSLLPQRVGNACSTSQAVCCSNSALDRSPRLVAGRRFRFDSFDDATLRFGRFQNLGGEAAIGLFRSAREQQRVEGVRVRCLLRGVGDSFWDGSERQIPGGYAFTGRMPYRSSRMPSVLRDIILQIEPLDIQQLAQDASSDAMDAMKRTISGMLGLLPSDQFSVVVETEREALARLLVSSMMTGYTLRNAEYRLSLQKSWESDSSEEGAAAVQAASVSSHPEVDGHLALDADSCQSEPLTAVVETAEVESAADMGVVTEVPGLSNLEGLPADARAYIEGLQSKLTEAQEALSSAQKTLSALEMEGVSAAAVPPATSDIEGNALLDYLRSLEAEKVAELSRPGTSDVEEAIRAVIDGLLGNLGTSETIGSTYGGTGMRSGGQSWEPRLGEGLGASPRVPGLEFQQTVTASRDYLARLLFWCMLLGHYARGVELRLDLNRTFSLHGLGTFSKEGSSSDSEAGFQRSWSKTPLDGEAPSF